MRKIIVSVNVTLDNFMAGPDGGLDWHFPFWDEQMAVYALEQLSMMDTLLLGRKTYEIMSDYWPNEHNEFACLMNNYKKIVISKSLMQPVWENSFVIKKDVARALRALKSQTGKDMIIYGSGTMLTALAKLQLIDEYWLWVHPVVIGKGIPLFKNIKQRIHLQFLKTRSFSSGVNVLHYKVNRLKT